MSKCNHPFYESTFYLKHTPLVGLDDVYPYRSAFGNHAFNECYEYVFDACAGPYLGMALEQQYIDTVVDKSTADEAKIAGSSSNILDLSIISFD